MKHLKIVIKGLGAAEEDEEIFELTAHEIAEVGRGVCHGVGWITEHAHNAHTRSLRHIQTHTQTFTHTSTHTYTHTHSHTSVRRGMHDDQFDAFYSKGTHSLYSKGTGFSHSHT